MQAEERKLRQAIIERCRWMNDSGLNQGTAGNLSVRFTDRMLITPSATPYESMTPAMIASMPLGGRADDGGWDGPLPPSTEWRMHRDILRARPEVGAVVHTHSTYATALAIARRPIPPCHYMIATFGGPDIRCAGYARFGTAALSKLALEALRDRNGCLLANHGMLALGDDLQQAMWRAVELETLARQHVISSLLGDPVHLSADDIREAAAAFADYGLRRPKPLSRRGSAGSRRGPAAKRAA